jgi:hypothetical protein
MTDWRQIQARIRKAKNSPDALTKLSELFQRTRDGMVAWEIGVLEEKAERTDEAVKWYTVAAERFRRAEWKKKAEEALVRLGAPVPAATAEPHASAHAGSNHTETAEAVAEETPLPLAYGEIPPAGYPGLAPVEGVLAAADPPSEDADSDGGPQKRKRRRGRRGGRGRRHKNAGAAPALPTQAFAASIDALPSKPEASKPLPFRRPEPRPASFEPPAIVERAAPEAIRPVPVETPPPAPQLPSERTAHGRAGDPALASRMAQLESMLRRLVSSPLHKLDDADQAPAGPGVFLLSDSDQITSYYVEACQTLRVGLGNLVRGGRSGKNNRGGRSYPESGFRSRLAEHLGITESRVTQYMKDYCVVRWIQLDDDAPHLAHFAIGVLRTPLNVE